MQRPVERVARGVRVHRLAARADERADEQREAT
jgi:hypothetical protein